MIDIGIRVITVRAQDTTIVHHSRFFSISFFFLAAGPGSYLSHILCRLWPALWFWIFEFHCPAGGCRNLNWTAGVMQPQLFRPLCSGWRFGMCRDSLRAGKWVPFWIPFVVGYADAYSLRYNKMLHHSCPNTGL